MSNFLAVDNISSVIVVSCNLTFPNVGYWRDFYPTVQIKEQKMTGLKKSQSFALLFVIFARGN